MELKMFERYKYKRATRGFFNPALNTGVSLAGLEDIFNLHFLNPNRLISKEFKDYSFMVVGVPSNSPLNSWAGQNWGANCYSLAQENALWYGRFSCESNSKLFLPKEKVIITLSHNVIPHYTQEVYSDFSESNLRRLAEGRSRKSEVTIPLDNSDRTLVSDVSVIELRSCIDTHFSRQFLSEDKLSI